MGVVPISLIDAAAQELMSRCSRALRLPNAGESIVEDTDLGDALEILARAASHMMLAPVVAGGKIEGLGSLFSVCEALSAEPYERSETQAKLYLCARTHPAIDVLVELAEPVDLRSTRAARKLLQMTASGLAAFSDGRTIWGLGRLSNQPYDIKREDLFEVQFKGRLRWELRHGNTVLFQVDNRRPKFPQAALYREAFEEYVGRIFPQASSKDIAALWSGVSGALDEKHGTIVIISPNAASESLRLAAQGTPIEPKMLDLRAVGAVTRIDGAVLFDPQGVCHALGIILDGLATPDGDRARGSRFNSALKYVSACPGSVAVVVSDDGSVDLLPNLRQRIPRSLVRAALDRLRAVGAGSQGAPPLGRVMDALYSLEFYLSAEECAEVNQLRRTIEAAERIEPYQLRIVYQDVAPDPEMNDSYLIDD